MHFCICSCKTCSRIYVFVDAEKKFTARESEKTKTAWSEKETTENVMCDEHLSFRQGRLNEAVKTCVHGLRKSDVKKTCYGTKVTLLDSSTEVVLLSL